MEISVDYDESFSESERLTLEGFEPILKEEWVRNSNSTSSLKWEMSVMSEKPRLNAVLKVKSNGSELHRESFYSISTKSYEQFRNEFVQKASRYSRMP